MPIRCVARKMSGGSQHEHIASIKWEQDGSGGNGVSTREQMIAYIDQHGNTSVYCPDQAGGKSAWVHVNSNGSIRYLQTQSDRRWTNNLLALPTF